MPSCPDAEPLRGARAVFRNPALLRLEAAYLLFAFGEWSTWIAVIVYAFGRGGAARPGSSSSSSSRRRSSRSPAVALARRPLPAGASPARDVRRAGGPHERDGRGAGGRCAGTRSIYALATLTATAVAFSRPIHASLLPERSSISPDDLTAANVVSGMARKRRMLVGPLGAGLLVALGGPAAVFAVAALGNLVGATAVLAIARNARTPRRAADPCRGGGRRRRRHGRAARAAPRSWSAIRCHLERPPLAVRHRNRLVGDVPRGRPRHLLRGARDRPPGPRRERGRVPGRGRRPGGNGRLGHRAAPRGPRGARGRPRRQCGLLFGAVDRVGLAIAPGLAAGPGAARGRGPRFRADGGCRPDADPAADAGDDVDEPRVRRPAGLATWGRPRSAPWRCPCSSGS